MLKRVATSGTVGTAAAMLALWLGRSIEVPAAVVPAEVFLIQSIHAALFTFGAIIATWYFLTAVALLAGEVLICLGAAPTAMLRLLRRFGAPFLRHVTAVAAISAVAASPAWAAPVEEPAPESQVSSSQPSSASRNTSFLVDLGWPTEPSTPPIPQPVATAEAPSSPDPGEAPAPQESATVTVKEGDTLWGIAQTHLAAVDPAHTLGDVAQEWPRWHSHNATTIGSNPNLLHPGMTLQAPPVEES